MLAAVSALVLSRTSGHVFRIGLTRASARIAVGLLTGRRLSLFLVLSGWHDFSNLCPSIKATDMPPARHLM